MRHLADATTTGGYTNKSAGRVGDNPVVGACAVSGTGQSENFIRHALAHDLAARAVISGLTPAGTGAGLIALDAAGRVAAPFNTGGIFLGWVTPDGEAAVATYRELFRFGRMKS